MRRGDEVCSDTIRIVLVTLVMTQASFLVQGKFLRAFRYQ